jgi:hypothetical protein
MQPNIRVFEAFTLREIQLYQRVVKLTGTEGPYIYKCPNFVV